MFFYFGGQRFFPYIYDVNALQAPTVKLVWLQKYEISANNLDRMMAPV